MVDGFEELRREVVAEGSRLLALAGGNAPVLFTYEARLQSRSAIVLSKRFWAGSRRVSWGRPPLPSWWQAMVVKGRRHPDASDP